MGKILGFCLGLFVFAAPVLASGSWFEPTRVQSNSSTGYTVPFNLRLFNNKYDCGDRFSNISVSVSGNRIDLVYTEGRDTGIVICPLFITDYGPSFPIPVLQNGYYEVYWDFYAPPCAPLDPLCELRAPPSYVGMLAVAGKISWSMRPDTVNANTPFSLQMLNDAYGNCYAGYANLNSAVARSGPITLTFSIDYYPAHMCLIDLHPSGPAYAMQGLPAGSYPVYAYEQPACMFDSIPCYPQIQFGVIVDTLVVRAASSLRPGHLMRLQMLKGFPLGIIRGYGVNGRKSKEFLK